MSSSQARIDKRLGLRRSQWARLLLLLGHAEGWEGLDPVRQEARRGRPVTTLTDKGRALYAWIRAAAE